MDEHYEKGRPTVLATLIPMTNTAEMNFPSWSAYEPASGGDQGGLHYTLAARATTNELFTVSISPNGLNGSIVSTAVVTFPASAPPPANIVYFFVRNGYVYVAFTTGLVVQITPATGAIVGSFSILSGTDVTAQLTLSSAFDPVSGIFYSNVVSAQDGNSYYLASKNIDHNATPAGYLGPLGPTGGVEKKGTPREDVAIASLPVYTPPIDGMNDTFLLLEMRNSMDAPFLYMAWLDPVSGNSTEVPLPDDWYLDWELDPMIFPSQWPGSQHRVWSFDPINNYAYFKLYDECGGTSSDCDEDESVVYMEYQKTIFGNDTYWDVAVEPIEPQLTQMIWVDTNVTHAAAARRQ